MTSISIQWRWPIVSLVALVVLFIVAFCTWRWARNKWPHTRFNPSSASVPTTSDGSREETSAHANARANANTHASSNNDAIVWSLNEDLKTDAAQSALRQYKRFSRWTVVSLAILGILCAALIGRPSTVNTDHTNAGSRDIVLCLDVSGSTLTYDRQIIAAYLTLIEDFQGERIGLSIFNSTSRTVFPLTDDYSVVKEQLEYAYTLLENVQSQKSIDKMSNKEYQQINDWLEGTQNVSDSTSLIGDGLVSCETMLPQFSSDSTASASVKRARKARNASIVLATDNVVSGSETYTLEEAMALAKASKISVDGLYSGADENSTSSAARSMKKAITNNGGTYVDLNYSGTIEDLVREIETTKSGSGKETNHTNLVDSPALWVALIALIMAIYFALAGRIRR